jgi:hypothetical protein
VRLFSRFFSLEGSLLAERWRQCSEKRESKSEGSDTVGSGRQIAYLMVGEGKRETQERRGMINFLLTGGELSCHCHIGNVGLKLERH